MTTILALVGSLRSASLNKSVAEAARESAPDGVDVALFDDLGRLPLYDQDLDTDTPPAPVAELRQAITDADAVLVVTPENNGLPSAAIKNAIDWASRPREAASLSGKPTAVISAGWTLSSVHETTPIALAVAGAVQAVEPTLINLAELGETAPADHAATVNTVRDVVTRLAAS